MCRGSFFVWLMLGVALIMIAYALFIYILLLITLQADAFRGQGLSLLGKSALRGLRLLLFPLESSPFASYPCLLYIRSWLNNMRLFRYVRSCTPAVRLLRQWRPGETPQAWPRKLGGIAAESERTA
ncbi:hypothetical protein CR205_11560 [Alteribacter lacisalsi]|uniref:Uncharacterized protein n=1 Tax=Alteribacter lacisalsi TaxID=2045244 RepID=A0A2W0HS22_9BACI|nr:hypothetical protein CR205_11560 [Alteribacter lacisalsi]